MQGVLINNDAQFIEVYPEGEGYTLSPQCYEIMRKNSEKYFSKYRDGLTIDEVKQMEENIRCGRYIAKKLDLTPTTVSNLYPNALLASGDFIHTMICVNLKDENNKTFSVGFNCLTSTKDTRTMSLECKQLINEDPKQKEKNQYCRPYDQLIICSKHMIEYPKATVFVTSEDYNGTGLINLRKTIYRELINKIPSLEKMPIRQMQEVTFSLIYNLTYDLSEEKFKKMKENKDKLEQQLLNLEPSKKQATLIQLNNIKNKMLQKEQEKEFTHKASEPFQEIVKMKNRYENESKK